MKIVSKASILERQQNKILLSLNLQTSSNSGKTHWTCQTCNICFHLHNYIRFAQFLIRYDGVKYQKVHHHLDHIQHGYYQKSKDNTSCVLCSKISYLFLSASLQRYFASYIENEKINKQKIDTNNNTYIFNIKDNDLNASLSLLFDSLPSDIYVLEIDNRFYQNYPPSYFSYFQPSNQMNITIYNESHQPTHNLVLCR